MYQSIREFIIKPLVKWSGFAFFFAAVLIIADNVK